MTNGHFTDVMLDIESTGLRPDRAGIIQIAAVKFNAETGEIDHNFFDRCLRVPKWRFWDEGTRSWWGQQRRETLMEILGRAEDPVTVMKDLVAWAVPCGTLNFWSKPTHFDFNFISSYCDDFELPQPFHFRMANDMNSFLRARYFPAPVPEVEIPFEGPTHNALYDSLHQLAVLLHHIKATSVGMARAAE